MSEEIHIEDHSSPIKTPQQLIAVVVLAFAIPITIISILAHLVTSGGNVEKGNPAMSEEAIAKRLQPVGEVVIDPNQPAPAPAAPVVAATPAGKGAAPAPAAAARGDAGKGKATYEAACTVCHAAGVAGAPKAGDKAAWAPRLKTGMDALYTASLKGKNAMPPKGGNLSLPDADVKAAVDYLVSLVK
jgi:cytochrome c5